MPTRRGDLRQSRLESRDRIIAAATELVRGTPYAALTVDDIMREAGFGRTIFYRHFDDLADLLLRAASEAIGELFQAQQAFSDARIHAGPDVVRDALRPAVAIYVQHGPLLRAVSEAAAGGDERVAEAQGVMRSQFNALLAEAMQASPHLARHPVADRGETARALNLLNEAYLMDAFGREPRVTPQVALQTLTEIWVALIHGEPAAGRHPSPVPDDHGARP
ncbi:MAG: Bacterial regulatory protein tetR family protein [Solirubrobacterales bacterium]|nr:Bacterial regulatory protein tetR family protein [Solirubrobacterales bacterium]